MPEATIEALLAEGRTFPPPSEFKRSEEHTSELQSRSDLVCRLLLEKKKKNLCSMPARENVIVIDTAGTSRTYRVPRIAFYQTPKAPLQQSLRQKAVHYLNCNTRARD